MRWTAIKTGISDLGLQTVANEISDPFRSLSASSNSYPLYSPRFLTGDASDQTGFLRFFVEHTVLSIGIVIAFSVIFC